MGKPLQGKTWYLSRGMLPWSDYYVSRLLRRIERAEEKEPAPHTAPQRVRSEAPPPLRELSPEPERREGARRRSQPRDDE